MPAGRLPQLLSPGCDVAPRQSLFLQSCPMDFAILVAVLAVGTETDSAALRLRSDDLRQPAIRWIAFDSAGRQVGRGTTPALLMHNSDGVPLTYCSDLGTPWLALTVEVRRNGQSGTMHATGACTRVTVRGKSVQVVGVEDPRGGNGVLPGDSRR